MRRVRGSLKVSNRGVLDRLAPTNTDSAVPLIRQAKREHNVEYDVGRRLIVVLSF